MKRLTMNKLLKQALVIGALSGSLSLSADYCFPAFVGAESSEDVYVSGLPGTSVLSISPLFGKAQIKQGTVKENGWLYGVRGNFDFICPNSFYLGAEVGYKRGDLRGRGDSAVLVNIIDPATRIETPTILPITAKTKSKYSDAWIEGRVGFTLSNVSSFASYITPYFVVGYERERDNFVSPSPIPLKNRLTYGYLGCGALSNFALSNQLSIGINAKLKWMFNAKTKSGGDPEIEDKGISSSNRFHWQIEVPLTYLVTPNISIALAPTYEYKNYAKHKFAYSGKENQTFHMWGGLVTLGYWF